MLPGISSSLRASLAGSCSQKKPVAERGAARVGSRWWRTQKCTWGREERALRRLPGLVASAPHLSPDHPCTPPTPKGGWSREENFPRAHLGLSSESTRRESSHFPIPACVWTHALVRGVVAGRREGVRALDWWTSALPQTGADLSAEVGMKNEQPGVH